MSAEGPIRVRRENGWRIERYPQTVAGAKEEHPDVRNGILRAALDLALRTGLESVTVDAVAVEAHVIREAVTDRFETREALLGALLDVVLARTLDAERELGGTTRRDLGAMLEAEMEGLRRQAKIVELTFMYYFARSDDLYRGRINAALATYRRSFEAALDGVELRRGVTPAVMSSIVLAFLQGAAVQIIREPENFDPTAALAEMRAMLG